MSAATASSPSQARSFATLFFFSGLNIVAGASIELVNMAYFGAGPQKDAYDIAYYIPAVLIYLFGLDMWKGLSTALFSRLSVSETEDRGQVFSSIVTLMVAVGGVACLVCGLLAPRIVPLVATGFHDQLRITLCVHLLRMNLPVILLLSLTGFFDSVLVAHHVYGWSSLSSVMLRVSQIVAVVGWATSYGIQVLPVGTVLGLSTALVLQVIMLRRQGIRYRPLYCDLHSVKLREALRQFVPLFLCVGVAQLAGLCIQNVASTGAIGTVACLFYAQRMVGTVSQLVVQPMGVSYAPRISRLVELRDISAARSLTIRSATWMTRSTWTVALLVFLGCRPLLTLLASFTRLTAADVELIIFFMRVLALVGFCRGMGILGIYYGLARAKGWRVFLIGLSDAVGVGATVLLLTATVGYTVALPTAILVGAACGGFAGQLWLERGLGGVARTVLRRIASWVLVIVAAGLIVGAIDGHLVAHLPGSPPLIHLLAIGLLTPLLLALTGWYFRLAEFDSALARVKDAVRRRLGLLAPYHASRAQPPEP